MKQPTKILLWQIFVLVAVLSHLTQAAKKPSSQKKRRCPSANSSRSANTACNDCILVRLKKPGGSGNVPSIRNLENRSIVPWTYDDKSNSQFIPQRVFNITCAERCVGYEDHLNAVPIQRTMLVLKKEKDTVYKMEFLTVTVGCTCVKAEVYEETP